MGERYPASPRPYSMTYKGRDLALTMTKIQGMKRSGSSIGKKGEIVLFRSADGESTLEVRLDQETVWLNAHQMAKLFARDRTVIVRHIRNVYKTKELSIESTCAKSAQVAADRKTRFMDLYNLDMIISVGYRVNSRRGTQFRIWATNVLRSHLVEGFTANERRLKELQRTLRLIDDILDRHDVQADEAEVLLRLVTDYSYALGVLDDYDHQRKLEAHVQPRSAQGISYHEAIEIIERLKRTFESSALFGREKDSSLHSSLNAVMQTFNGKDVYPSLEEKAANLLYFLVKNHSFVDGNKRIAAALFLWFMENNGMLYRPDGGRRIANAALVAITLMIAESAARDKEQIVRLVMSLISERKR
jgi:prophage maintenance system killer protein